MADRLVLGEPAPVKGQRPGRASDGAGPAAVGAGLLLPQGVGLLAQQGREDPLGQPAGGGAGDVFHGLEIDIEARAGIAEGTPGDDFAPPGGAFTDILEFLGRKLATRHGLSLLELTPWGGNAFLPPLYALALWRTKLFLASCSWPLERCP